jgi:hypothetical protein
LVELKNIALAAVVHLAEDGMLEKLRYFTPDANRLLNEVSKPYGKKRITAEI